MIRRNISTLFCFVMFLPAARAQQSRPALELRPVDPLIKVFRDAPRLPRMDALAEVARGEYASLQVVVRSATVIDELRATLGTLAGEDSSATPLEPRTPRFVGYVPVDRPIPAPPKDQLRKPPADFPDPLLENETIGVPAGQVQPIWITVPVPLSSRPGLYRGTLRVAAKTQGGELTAECPITVRVYDVEIKHARLWVTNWFNVNASHMQIKAPAGSPEYWQLLHRYARNMAEHGQNVAMISPISLATYKAGADGKLDIDFSTFDRWVSIFKEEGVLGRIEGGHLGGRAGAWESQFVVNIRRIKDGNVVDASVDPASPEADQFYSQFLPELVKHLRGKGWLDVYMQHLADEPTPQNSASYKAIAALVRKYAPGMKIIEACMTRDLAGSIDIWVPLLNSAHTDYDFFRQRQKAGEEFWFYTCLAPQGEYANRFIEQPLIKTRLLHWINYRYGITGYLHWGYNWWPQESPFKKTTPAHPGPPYLPAGDAWIVYPGKDGPLDSIRFEAMRDGIVDYELLSMLGERSRKAALDVASKHVLAFDQYNTDVNAFRATRRDLLERLSKE